MSKSKEELNKIKEEVEAVNEKLQELTEEEIAQVNGGIVPGGSGYVMQNLELPEVKPAPI